MRHLLLFFILLFSFTGCQDKEQQQQEQAKHDAQIAQQARTELLSELEKEKKAQDETNNRFSHMGVIMDQGTITIDTNKTKDFLKQKRCSRFGPIEMQTTHALHRATRVNA